MEALTEREWLDEIHAAVTEVPQNDRPEAEENLRVILDEDLGEPNAVAVRFQCRYWAEDISFRVLTLADIVERQYQLMPMNKAMLEYALYEENRVYAVQLPHDRLRKDQTEFAMLMKFASGVDLSHVIGRVERWDGSGGNGRRESGTKWYA